MFLFFLLFMHGSVTKQLICICFNSCSLQQADNFICEITGTRLKSQPLSCIHSEPTDVCRCIVECVNMLQVLL
jgi:hypothetical protein